MFTHFQVHSHYSLLEAIGSPKWYLSQAQALGMNSLALTDFWWIYGAIEFYQAAKKLNIQPIIGVELGYVQDMHHKDPYEQAGTILLIAKNYEGYQQLLQLISKAHIEWFHKIPRIDYSCLSQFSEGLITLLWGTRSRLGKAIVQWTALDTHHEKLQQLIQLFWKEQICMMRSVQDSVWWEQQQVNEYITTIANTFWLTTIVSWDVHYIQEHDQNSYEIALAIKDSKRIYDTDRRLAKNKLHLQSEEEIRSRLTKTTLTQSQIDTMIEQTNILAASIDLQIPMDKILFPIYESPEEIQKYFTKREKELVTSTT